MNPSAIQPFSVKRHSESR